MAKAKFVSIPEPPKPDVLLTLTHLEAQIIRELTRRIYGSTSKSYREHSSNVFTALYNLGVEQNHDVQAHISGHISFRNNDA